MHKWVYNLLWPLQGKQLLFGCTTVGINKEIQTQYFSITTLHNYNDHHSSFHFLYIKMFIVLSVPFTSWIKAKPFIGTPQTFFERLGRLCNVNTLTLLLLLHTNLQFKFSVSATTLPNSSSIPNTLKKLPRNPCLDQQKQFGIISRFHHFLLESLKH